MKDIICCECIMVRVNAGKTSSQPFAESHSFMALWIERIILAFSYRSGVMDIDEEIKARIRAAKAWDRESKFEDFQIMATENGYVLINLKTRRAQLIYDEFSELHDLEQLFPECFAKKS